MRHALFVMLVALTVAPGSFASREVQERPGESSESVNIGRDGPADTRLSQRCFAVNGQMRCF